MRFQRRGGRKRIVAPDGSTIVPTTGPQPDGTLVKALARAWRWQRLLDAGVYSSVTDLSEAEAISKSYVHRILRLALLAPEIVGLIWCGTLFDAASRSPECNSKLGVRRSATKLLIHLDD